jgi:hypothetical protein
VFSGFVHGASTHIFDLFDAETGQYRLTGGIHEADGCLGYLHNAAKVLSVQPQAVSDRRSHPSAV